MVRLWDTRKSAELLSWEVYDSVVALEWDSYGGLGVGMKVGGVQVWDVLATDGGEGDIEIVNMRQGAYGSVQTCQGRAKAHACSGSTAF